MRSLRVLAPLVGAFLLLPLTVSAQSRPELLRQAQTALDDFDAPRAIRLARAALNPALGPLDSTWVRGVHVLTQTLIEEQQQPLAKTWAQWATRVQPALAIDSVSFISSVAALLRQAKVDAAPTGTDAAVRVTYQWPAATGESVESRFRVATGGTPVSVLVRGIGLVGPQGLVLPPGSYELEVTANGFLPLRVTREALPGVTAEFSFTLVTAAVAAATLDAPVAARLARAARPLQITRFGAPQACAAGVASGGERLLLTSYHAIRGADAIAAGGEVRVAAYDVATNLAVLVLPAAAPDTLPLTTTTIEGQSLWGVSLADCAATPTPTTRVLLQGGAAGSLSLSETLAAAATGSPLVDYQGSVVGVWTAGGRGAPASVIAPLLARAKENIAGNRTMTPQQVAAQENHRYGSVVIAVDVPNATVRVTPLEAWHWQELRAEGLAPFTFRGAAGRYRVEVSAPNVASRTQDVTLRAGETLRTAISLRSVAAAPGGPAPAAQRRGLPKWVWAVAIGGAIGGAALAMGGGGGGGGGGGTIVIEVPNPTVR